MRAALVVGLLATTIAAGMQAPGSAADSTDHASSTNTISLEGASGASTVAPKDPAPQDPSNHEQGALDRALGDIFSRMGIKGFHGNDAVDFLAKQHSPESLIRVLLSRLQRQRDHDMERARLAADEELEGKQGLRWMFQMGKQVVNELIASHPDEYVRDRHVLEGFACRFHFRHALRAELEESGGQWTEHDDEHFLGTTLRMHLSEARKVQLLAEARTRGVIELGKRELKGFCQRFAARGPVSSHGPIDEKILEGNEDGKVNDEARQQIESDIERGKWHVFVDQTRVEDFESYCEHCGSDSFEKLVGLMHGRELQLLPMMHQGLAVEGMGWFNKWIADDIASTSGGKHMIELVGRAAFERKFNVNLAAQLGFNGEDQGMQYLYTQDGIQSHEKTPVYVLRLHHATAEPRTEFTIRTLQSVSWESEEGDMPEPFMTAIIETTLILTEGRKVSILGKARAFSHSDMAAVKRITAVAKGVATRRAVAAIHHEKHQVAARTIQALVKSKKARREAAGGVAGANSKGEGCENTPGGCFGRVGHMLRGVLHHPGMSVGSSIRGRTDREEPTGLQPPSEEEDE